MNKLAYLSSSVVLCFSLSSSPVSAQDGTSLIRGRGLAKTVSTETLPTNAKQQLTGAVTTGKHDKECQQQTHHVAEGNNPLWDSHFFWFIVHLLLHLALLWRQEGSQLLIDCSRAFTGLDRHHSPDGNFKADHFITTH
jgi:hypothetical protein